MFSVTRRSLVGHQATLADIFDSLAMSRWDSLQRTLFLRVVVGSLLLDTAEKEAENLKML